MWVHDWAFFSDWVAIIWCWIWKRSLWQLEIGSNVLVSKYSIWDMTQATFPPKWINDCSLREGRGGLIFVFELFVIIVSLLHLVVVSIVQFWSIPDYGSIGYWLLNERGEPDLKVLFVWPLLDCNKSAASSCGLSLYSSAKDNCPQESSALRQFQLLFSPCFQGGRISRYWCLHVLSLVFQGCLISADGFFGLGRYYSLSVRFLGLSYSWSLVMFAA